MRREHAHDTVGSFRTQLQSLRAPSTLLPRRIPCPCGHACLPCNECPPHALGPIPPRLGSLRSPRALEPSSEHVASENHANGQQRGSPMPPTQRCPSKGTRISLSPCNECSPRALGPFIGSSRSSQALEQACCLGKTCQWPTLRLAPGAHPCLLPNATHIKARGCPSSPTLPIKRYMDVSPPHATSALLMCSVLSRLVEEPSIGHVALEKRANGQRCAHLGGSPMPSAQCCPSKGTWMPSPLLPCNECPSHALDNDNF